MNGTFPCLAPMAFVKRAQVLFNFIMQHLLQFRKLKNKIQSPRNSPNTSEAKSSISSPKHTLMLYRKKKEKRTDISYKCASRKGINFQAIYAKWEKLPFSLLCTHASKQATASSTRILKTQQHLFSTVLLSTFMCVLNQNMLWRTRQILPKCRWIPGCWSNTTQHISRSNSNS